MGVAVSLYLAVTACGSNRKVEVVLTADPNRRRRQSGPNAYARSLLPPIPMLNRDAGAHRLDVCIGE